MDEIRSARFLFNASMKSGRHIASRTQPLGIEDWDSLMHDPPVCVYREAHRTVVIGSGHLHFDTQGHKLAAQPMKRGRRSRIRLGRRIGRDDMEDPQRLLHHPSHDVGSDSLKN